METINKQHHQNKLTYLGVAWIDVQDPDDETLEDLKQKYSLHPIHLQESTQAVQHNQVERGKGYLFFVIHFPVYHAAASKITFGQLGIFLGKDYVVTIRNKEDAVLEAFYRAVADPEIGKTHFGRGAAYLLYLILDKLLGELATFTYKVVNELDDLEDDVFDSNGSDAQEIGKMRQKIVRLMQLISPKRAIMGDLTEQVGSFAGHDVAKYYSNEAKTVNKLWEVINEAKETVEIYKDADFTISTEQTNQILTVLTLIFTFTIPVTVFGALYGMNVLLPGGIEAGSWTFFGRYTMFAIVVALSVLSAIGMYIYFKKRRWI
ncbi:MAG TPA: magnesium transporter CorA family protein [Verrucomicrobiae bacterium]|nr:magnesium transporter CorA family protein [Verrucomicrobiae bacterium]